MEMKREIAKPISTFFIDAVIATTILTIFL
uniref:Uncharacterized protein n=1 Tax=Candidatus Kentrum sp. FW TaxID=2126338 RepID=A0A450TIR4_9GAMM|nr:MAG: hypothetical protein BECKFW1821C_GA0114237_101138 [Candidatus Kentron sp. FW]